METGDLLDWAARTLPVRVPGEESGRSSRPVGQIPECSHRPEAK